MISNVPNSTQKEDVPYNDVHKNVQKFRGKMLENHIQRHNTDKECHNLT